MARAPGARTGVGESGWAGYARSGRGKRRFARRVPKVDTAPVRLAYLLFATAFVRPMAASKLPAEDIMDRVAEWVVFALMLAAATAVMLWMAGAIYYDVCGGAKWGRWVAVGWAVGVIALFAVWQPLWQPFVVLLGVAGAVPRLVVPAEAEPRPRLGPERGRAAAGRARRGRGHDRERPQLRVSLAGRFHAALRDPHAIISRI